MPISIIRAIVFLLPFLYIVAFHSSGCQSDNSSMQSRNVKNNKENTSFQHNDNRSPLDSSSSPDVAPRSCNSMGCSAMSVYVIFTHVSFTLQTNKKYQIQVAFNGCSLSEITKFYTFTNGFLQLSKSELYGSHNPSYRCRRHEVRSLTFDAAQGTVSIHVLSNLKPKGDMVEMSINLLEEDITILKINKIIKGFTEIRPNGNGCEPVCWMINKKTINMSENQLREEHPQDD